MTHNASLIYAAFCVMKQASSRVFPVPPKKSDDPHFRLRVPAELKQRIEHAASANNRSMNAEIVARLEATFSDPPDAPPLDLAAVAKVNRGIVDLGKRLEALDFDEITDALQEAFRKAVEAGRKELQKNDTLTEKTDRLLGEKKSDKK